MKKILALFGALVVIGAMATPALADNEDAPGKNKVTICHVTPGNSVTLTIPEDQANGHLTGKAAGHDINGPVNDYLGECREEPKPTPTPTPTETPTTPPVTPPVGPPAPPKDYCPDLDGVQWEGYDCNTGQVVPVPEPTEEATPEPPVVVVPPVTVPPIKAPKPKEVNGGVAVVTTSTIPNSVPAGDGSSQGSPNWFLVVLIAAAGGLAGYTLVRLTSQK